MRALFLLLALLPSFALAQNQQLRIANPDRLWQDTGININETVFEVHPKGTYAEVEMFISFSSSNPSYFSQSELLEMFSFFELSEEVTVSDLWLWFGDQILVAHIIDRWTANRVYEGIVNRQQDPAILFKNSPTSYELRVYPFTRNQVRKLKISFLIPTEKYRSVTSIPLPTQLHRLAQNILEDAEVRYFIEDQNPDLSVSGQEDLTFDAAVDSLGRMYWSADLEAAALNSSLSLNVSDPNSGDTFLANYTDSTGQYYSLSFIPEDILDINISKTVAIVFDFAASNSNATKDEILNLIQANLKANFSEKDRFNFIYSNVSDQVLSPNWINGSDAAIDSLFEEIRGRNILSVSNLDDLLVSGIDFIKEKGSGSILLISSSDTYHDFQDANAFSESIIDYAGNDLPKISVIDIQKQNAPFTYRNGRNYRGNEYLYGIFTRDSGGELFDYKDSPDVEIRLESGIQYLGNYITNYTIYPTFAGGFTYGNFQNSSSEKIPVSAPFIQTGMYFGDLPLSIQFTGTTEDTVFNEEIMILESSETDSSLKRFWISRKINRMEQSSPNNDDIAQIIDYSMENRLMSQYTSFLSIEPGDTTLISEEQNGDGPVTTDVENENPDSFEIEELKAYPNPFNPNVNIEVNLSEPWDASNSRIVIYNLLGQKIAVLNTSQFNGMHTFTVNWDVSQSTLQMATGVYLVSVETPMTNKKIKITYLK
ncbi:T9SS type A sorting domain-containing protein [Gracilimonas mengyeensis]|uniref:Ca-activated chloride channel family protein n=1 Tax=Gracilimonas mengyeensis TaxID=1302730 RepID=A0A521EQ86_9BACT|nr:T9SS type A sorting domain-containing protein [Gracilimonas mengyeensis]SMO86088.1 Ca-activated chloride channel family protein [Gracilimonas mengyeensis]